MRAPLKYLAPLILVPFLACTDTPAEPDTVEATASFDSDRPHSPGLYVEGSIDCQKVPPLDGNGGVAFSLGSGWAGVYCEDFWRGNPEGNIIKDWLPVTGSQLYWHLEVYGEDMICHDGGYIAVDDLMDGRVTPSVDPTDDCYGVLSFDFRVIRVLTIK